MNTQLVIVHLSVCGPIDAGRAPFLLSGGDMLEGIGPRQHKLPLMPTTIGALRDDWGDDSVGGSLSSDCPCYLFTNDTDGSGVTMVLVDTATFMLQQAVDEGIAMVQRRRTFGQHWLYVALGCLTGE
jgi:hypothetical protein